MKSPTSSTPENILNPLVLTLKKSLSTNSLTFSVAQAKQTNANKIILIKKIDKGAENSAPFLLSFIKTASDVFFRVLAVYILYNG